MNSLLPYSLKDTVSTIFDTVSEGVVEKHLIDHVMQRVSSAERLDAPTLARLSWRPHLIADLIDAHIPSASDLDHLVRNASEAINIVAIRPYLFPLWRDMIMAEPEAVEELANLMLRHPSRVNVGLTFEDLLDALQTEPVRYLRVMRLLDEDAWREASRVAFAEAHARRTESAAWAFLYLSATKVPDDQPLSSDLVQALSADEGYAYLAMRLLRDRVLSPVVWEPLEPAIRTPRWAYHALRDGLLIERELEAEEILLSHPGWLVEWLNDTNASQGIANAKYQLCARRAHGHELVFDMHHWHKSRTVSRALKRTPVAQAAA